MYVHEEKKWTGSLKRAKYKRHRFEPEEKPKIAVTVADARREAYDFNVGIVKQYGQKYKVSYHRFILKKGCGFSKRERGTANDEKLDSNLRRAKGKIREYAMCNEWQYFVTLTLDKCKQDRYDIKAYIKRLGQRIRDLNKTREEKITYLLIPEQHKDGAWHMHGFINGLTEKDVTGGKVKGRRRKVYHWKDYEERFGFSDMEEIENHDRACSYVTKYVTKDMTKCITEMNAKTYYCSKGLKKAQEIKRGCVTTNYTPSYFAQNGEIVYSEQWHDSRVDACLCVYSTTETEEWQPQVECIVDSVGIVRQPIPPNVP